MADPTGSIVEGNGGVSRREFIANAGLTGAGALAGISFFIRDPEPKPDRGKDPVNVGFIGVGSRGGALLRSMLKVPGSMVVAVADVSEEARDTAVENIQEKEGREYDPLATGDYRELLEKSDVEAVVIATPHFMHGPMAMDALEAGKHVYVEKAMAFTIGECLDLHRMAKEREGKQVFQVGHQRHYSKLYRKVRDMIHEGVIGNVTAIRAQWNRNDDGNRPVLDPRIERLINWRLYSEYSGGLMTEFGSHQIDVANMVLAPRPRKGEPHRIVFPRSVCAMGGLDHPRLRRQKGRDTTDNVHAIFTYRAPYRERGELLPGGKREWIETGETYEVRLTYMSIMTNELLGPSEMIFGDEGTIEVSLAGGDFWKESKALANPDNLAEGTNPAQTRQKSILKTGATIAAVKKGIRKPDEEISVDKDRTDWSDFTGKIVGEHSPQETLLALDGFLSDIRRCRKVPREEFRVAANADVGLGGAVSAIMANIAMKEGRTVHWKEFGPLDPG